MKQSADVDQLALDLFTSEGAAQRYRKPLWRPFKAGP
jgi:hypothetical protein